MSISNVKRYRITSPDGTMTASLMAVLPKDIDVNKYLSEATQRFDWKAYSEAQAKQFRSQHRRCKLIPALPKSVPRLIKRRFKSCPSIRATRCNS